LSLLPNMKNMILKEEEVQRRIKDILTNDCFDKAEHCYPGLYEKVADVIDEYFIVNRNHYDVVSENNLDNILA
ncbi:hypothetical protein H312_02269, partial [Anncaliia algerae PRA339]